MITKEDMDAIREIHVQAKKDFKNRCLFVIETLVGGDIIYEDINKLKDEIYMIAHVGLETCGNSHDDWVTKVEEMFTKFEKEGLI